MTKRYLVKLYSIPLVISAFDFFHKSFNIPITRSNIESGAGWNSWYNSSKRFTHFELFTGEPYTLFVMYGSNYDGDKDKDWGKGLDKNIYPKEVKFNDIIRLIGAPKRFSANSLPSELRKFY